MKQTSKDAFVQSRESAKSNRHIILNTMNAMKSPMTSEQISEHCGLRYDQVWRRMSELERDNKIRCTNELDVTSSGRFAHRWELIK